MICQPGASRFLRRTTLLLLAATVGCDASPDFEIISLSFDASYSSPFGYIGGIRELQDNSVFVADPLGVAVVLADLDSASVDTVGRVGSGPGEYRQPDRVLPLPGDSTLLVDLGNARLWVLDPEGHFSEPYPIARQTSSGVPALVLPRFTDRLGRLYFLAEGAGGRRSATGAVARFDRTTFAVDTLALVALPDRSTPPPPAGAGPAIPPDLFTPRDEWAVAVDGCVATIAANDYSVTWVKQSGETVRGTPTFYEPVRVEAAAREELLVEVLASQLNMGSGGESDGIGMQRGFAPGALPDVNRIDWPEVLPAFRPGRAVVSPRGLLWVERYVLPGSAPLIDVFDGRGTKIAEITLPTGRRVVGFGSGAVYLAKVDDVGLEWLERYHLPEWR